MMTPKGNNSSQFIEEHLQNLNLSVDADVVVVANDGK